MGLMMVHCWTWQQIVASFHIYQEGPASKSLQEKRCNLQSRPSWNCSNPARLHGRNVSRSWHPHSWTCWMTTRANCPTFPEYSRAGKLQDQPNINTCTRFRIFWPSPTEWPSIILRCWELRLLASAHTLILGLREKDIHVQTYACTYIYIYMCMHVTIYIYIYVCVWHIIMTTNMYTHTHTHKIYIYIHRTYLHTHTHVYTYIHINIYIYIHIYRERERERETYQSF